MGYTITIGGPSDSSLYLDGNTSNTDNNKKIIASAGTVSNPLPITDNTSSGGANYRGTWGYSLTSSTGTGTFIGLTSTATTLITKTSASGDGTSTTDTIPVYYGVSALPTQAPGTYKLANAQKINYAITAPIRCTANAVTLNLTNASSITIDGTTYTTSDSPVSLSYGTHTISGTYPNNYEFNSWSATGSVSVASTTSASTTIDVTGDGGLTLSGKSKPIAFQSATSANCGQNMYDDRGTAAYKSVIYTTAKIGNLCWMTRNLDLPGGTALSSSDTNLNGNTTSYTLPASSTSGFSNDSTAYVYNSGRTTCSNDSSTGSCYSYYSYVAATAGTNPSSGEATSDICPKGWRLPTKAEYDTLKGTYTTGATLTASPFLGVYGGYYYNSSFYSGGSYGTYWSSTTDDSSSAYNLYFNSSNAYTNNSYKSSGRSVRCVMKPTIADATYMQDVTSAMVTATAEGATATLTDKRDNKTYTVKKINGALWMTQNLRYLGDTNSATKTMKIGNNNSNVANKSITLYSLNSSNAGNFNAYSSHCDSTNGYNYACVYDSGDTSKGVWYNYYAATAGTISGSSNSTVASQDICPKNWHLPSNDTSSPAGSIDSITSQATAFSPVTGGIYNSGLLRGSGSGSWWSTTAFNATIRRYLYYNGSSLSTNSGNRSLGCYIRCVRTS